MILEGRPISSPAKLFSFWSGAPLGYLESLCLASMLRAGHPVEIYTYNKSLSVPSGVAVRSAEEVLPSTDPIMRLEERWALKSDLFRYLGLKKELGIWVDLDVLFLKNLNGLGDWVFGWQDPCTINGAVLKMPRDSETLDRLLALCHSEVVIAPQWPLRRKIKQRAKSLFGKQTPIHELEWGIVGPLAITKYLTEARLLHHCQPYDVFYPLDHKEAVQIFAVEGPPVEGLFTSSTRTIHLWNEMIKKNKPAAPPSGSFLARICEALDINV